MKIPSPQKVIIMKLSFDEIMEHEIKLRVMDETYNKRFDELESLISSINNKINRLITYVLCSLVIPIALHFYNIL